MSRCHLTSYTQLTSQFIRRLHPLLENDGKRCSKAIEHKSTASTCDRGLTCRTPAQYWHLCPERDPPLSICIHVSWLSSYPASQCQTKAGTRRLFCVGRTIEAIKDLFPFLQSDTGSLHRAVRSMMRQGFHRPTFRLPKSAAEHRCRACSNSTLIFSLNTNLHPHSATSISSCTAKNTYCRVRTINNGYL